MKKMRLHQITINRAVIIAGIILFSIVCTFPISAADYAAVSRQMHSVQSAQTNQMLVTVTADPATYTPGSSLTIHVVVTLNQNPYPTSIPVQISASDPQITITPHSRATDNSGSFYATLTTTSSTSGVIHVQAQASDLYCGGVSAAPNQQCTVTSAEGSVDIPQQAGTQQFIQTKQQQSEQQSNPPPVQPASYQPPVNQPPVNQPQQQAVNQPPVAVISVDKYAGSAPLIVNFDARKSYAPSGSIRTYTWNFGDGSSGNGYVAQHQYSTPGTYTASLVVTDNNELSSTPATTQITIWSPIAPIVYNVGRPCDPATGCVPTSITPVPTQNPVAQPSPVPTPGTVHVRAPPALVNPVTQCMLIDKPGNFTLMNDITAAPDALSCIKIVSSDVTFDGNGKKITAGHYDQNTRGILVIPFEYMEVPDQYALDILTGKDKNSNIVIKHVDVSGWGNGITLYNIVNGSISESSIHDNVPQGWRRDHNFFGIKLVNTKNIEITQNHLANNDVGIGLGHSTENIIGGLPVCQNLGNPATSDPVDSLSYVKLNRIENNRIGILFDSADNNQIIGNIIRYNWNQPWNNMTPSGIYFQDSKKNEIKFNTIDGNFDGIHFGGEWDLHYAMYLKEDNLDNKIFGNSIEDNQRYGIFLESKSNNNEIHSNKFHGYGNGFPVHDFGLPMNYNQPDPLAQPHEEGFEKTLFIADNTEGNIIFNNLIEKPPKNYINTPPMFYPPKNFFSITATIPGKNIIGGPSIGGNYWKDELGVDNNKDGFADKAFCTYSGTFCDPASNDPNVDRKPLVPSEGGIKFTYSEDLVGKTCENSPLQVANVNFACSIAGYLSGKCGKNPIISPPPQSPQLFIAQLVLTALPQPAEMMNMGRCVIDGGNILKEPIQVSEKDFSSVCLPLCLNDPHCEYVMYKHPQKNTNSGDLGACELKDNTAKVSCFGNDLSNWEWSCFEKSH